MSGAGRPAHAVRPLPVRRQRPHGGRGRPAARADDRLAGQPVARSAARRLLDLAGGGDARAPARGGRRGAVAARRRPGLARAALRTRGPADRDVARDRDGAGRERRTASRRRARLARVRAARGGCRRGRTRSSSATSSASSSASTPPPSFVLRGEYMSLVIEAVVFDLDGVLVDSEHVWDEVREELARERGGRWHERAQADMMGMSSTEWSRYMHDVIGLAERLTRSTPRSCGGCRSATRRSCRSSRARSRRSGGSPSEYRLGLASSSNRPLIDAVLAATGLGELFEATVSSEEVPRGKPAPGRLPRGAATARRAGRAGCGGRGLGERDPLGTRCRHARRRDPEPPLSARSRRARAGRRRARVARRADARHRRRSRADLGKRGARRSTGPTRDADAYSPRAPAPQECLPAGNTRLRPADREGVVADRLARGVADDHCLSRRVDGVGTRDRCPASPSLPSRSSP